MEKARSVIKHTWELALDPAAVAAKLSKSAAKITAPKRKPTSSTWDLPYLFQFLFEHKLDTVNALKLKDFTAHVLRLLKGLSGWRTDDLTHLFVQNGIKFHEDDSAVDLRLFDIKNYKNKWTPWVNFPRLHDDFASLCLVRLLRLLLNRQQAFQRPSVEVISPERGSNTVIRDEPVFVFIKNGERTASPYKPATLANFFAKGFLANVRTGPGTTLKSDYGAHSCRHAVVSALHDMQVSLTDISSMTLNTPSTLETRYLMAVKREWPLPVECCAQQPNLPLKLLMPFVHHFYTEGDGALGDGKCKCSQIAFKASKE